MDFHVVYILEAHASDLWQDPDNLSDGVIFASPKDFAQRSAMGQICLVKLGIKFPAVVDKFDNTTERAYAAWPDRLYVVDRDGRIAYKSAPGPFGFHTERLAETLAHLDFSGSPSH